MTNSLAQFQIELLGARTPAGQSGRGASFFKPYTQPRFEGVIAIDLTKQLCKPLILD